MKTILKTVYNFRTFFAHCNNNKKNVQTDEEVVTNDKRNFIPNSGYNGTQKQFYSSCMVMLILPSLEIQQEMK